MASTAFAEWAPSRTFRIEGASPRSESMTRKPALFGPPEPDLLTITKLIELARLSAQDTAQMVRSVAFHDSAFTGKMFDEKSPSHRQDSIAGTVFTRRCP